jgi:5-methylcytosine-specific restriction protein A
MSTNRAIAEAGWVDPGRLPVGPNGRPLCRWCNIEVPKSRRTFCSRYCVNEHRLRSDPGYLRDQTFERDRGICAICGCDAEKLRRVLWCALRYIGRRRLGPVWPDILESLGVGPGRLFSKKSLWDADHIVPVIEGGGECDLSNIRTLCTGCHSEATRQLRNRIKLRRDS